jgi:predicted RecB family nuclease
MTSPGAAVPKTASPGDAVVDIEAALARRDGYFFFAVFLTDRLRAGAAFFVRFLVVFFIAIVNS